MTFVECVAGNKRVSGKHSITAERERGSEIRERTQRVKKNYGASILTEMERNKEKNYVLLHKMLPRSCLCFAIRLR